MTTLDGLLSEAEGPMPEVAAVLDAVPGWHAALMVQTGMGDTNDPDYQFGKRFVRLLVIPIKRWGFACPENLDVSNPRPSSSFSLSSLFGDFLSTPPIPTTILPLDPREDEPTFFRRDQLTGVYPPEAGDSEAVLAKTQERLEKLSENEMERKRRQEPAESKH